MAYECIEELQNEMSNLTKHGSMSFKAKDELNEVYFKAVTLNKIMDIIKSGRNLGLNSDSEIILLAIEHELKYLEANDEEQ
ncbi:hypothetical protein ACWEXK_12315 [Staphylococcus xylosus]|uniref:hypothetical protein n=1 Tax=Staphylococcus xylosus TaxID=1288 RepID=UPI000D1F9653|nr:hypothetical protein [Staphylococcus xylosus]PTI18324.1 hypothetical protein BU115_12135 [Staphylococcus xylosus]HDP5827268.1 hypothetical protein [Staphylococcus aureus]